MVSDISAPGANPYRILIEDRLAFVAREDSLDAVIDDLGHRLSSVPDSLANADLAIWRADRLEAVIFCRPGHAYVVTRLVGTSPAPTAPRRPRATIGALMLVVLGSALILASLRSPKGIELLKSIVMLGLMAAVAGSAVATLYSAFAFIRDEDSSRG
jgi:hypothetical protein